VCFDSFTIHASADAVVGRNVLRGARRQTGVTRKTVLWKIGGPGDLEGSGKFGKNQEKKKNKGSRGKLMIGDPNTMDEYIKVNQADEIEGERAQQREKRKRKCWVHGAKLFRGGGGHNRRTKRGSATHGRRRGF